MNKHRGRYIPGELVLVSFIVGLTACGFYKTTTNMILAPLVNLGRIEETETVLQINAMEIEGCCGTICSPAVYQGDLKKHFLGYLRSADR